MNSKVAEIVRTEYVLSRPTDAELLDEFAKAALSALSMRLVMDCDGSVRALGNRELVHGAFEIADAMMAERKRRREGR